MDTLDWSINLKGKILGLRKHLLKEDAKSIPQAKLRMQRFVNTKKILNS